jgi:hypothetical protein
MKGRDRRDSADYQQAVGEFVAREVIHCVSGLVSEIGREKFDEWSHLFGRDDIEIYEHWIVSERLADRLEQHGEVIERDFYGLTVWGRATTGQAILLDGVICAIYDEAQS